MAQRISRRMGSVEGDLWDAMLAGGNGPFLEALCSRETLVLRGTYVNLRGLYGFTRIRFQAWN